MPSVAERLRQSIRERGPMTFAAFMEEALYGEGGYYARERPAIGPGGDYVTGSSLSPLFGRATARLLARLDPAVGGAAELLEAGFGGGEHLAAVAASAAGSGRRLRAWDRVARPVPAGVERLERLESVAPGEVRGLIFSYELFDALPVHRLRCRADGGLAELWVGLEGDPEGEERFAWAERRLSDERLADLVPAGVALEPGQIADLAPGWAPLYRRLAERLGHGLMVTCDYGFDGGRLLDPRVRSNGTLACYRRHRVHRDPFRAVGEQDLTAHVDFDALRAAGEAAGLATVAFTRQALWLTACGLFDELAGELENGEPAGEGAAARREAAALLDGEGMGEEIRVLVQARGIDPWEVLDRRLLAG